MAHPEQLRIQANALVDRAVKLRNHADQDLWLAEKSEAEAQALESEADSLDAARAQP